MTASRPLDEMYDLADAYCDGSLDGDDLKRLDQLLLDNIELRRAFTVYVQTVAEVERQGARSTLADPLDLPPTAAPEAQVVCSPPSGSHLASVLRKPKMTSVRHPFGISLSVAACTLVVVLGVLAFMNLPQRRPQLAGENAEHQPRADIAVLVAGTAECRWAANSPALQPGQLVPIDQPFELASGLLKLVYGNQTRCIVQGPATFRVTAQNAIRLDDGRLAANVPSGAVGFRVQTPWAEVIDLGTEFGVAVEKDQQTAVHVFQGTVQVNPLLDGLASMTVTAGQAVHLQADGTTVATTPSAADRVAFVLQLPQGPGGGYAESRFDNDTEGWRATLDAQMPSDHQVEAGPHGGYLEAFDAWERLPERIQHEPMFFSFLAPLPYCGDHRAAYGKKLTFDLRIRGGDGRSQKRFCRLQGAGILVGFPITTPPNDNTWTHHEIPLKADTGWVRLDLPDAPKADAKDLQAVLSDLRRVLIPGEFYFGNETSGLDNVVLGAGDESDETAEKSDGHNNS